MSQQQLVKELSQYHFGILPFFKSLSQQSDLKLKYATTLKLFNYLEAGIPTIVSEDIIYQNWILNRYNCGISINEKDVASVRDKILNSNYPGMLASVRKTRENLSLKSNTKRLLSFYKSIIN